MRHNLEKSLKEESELCKLNMAKIQHSWRKIMRESKVQQLKHNVEIMSQNHEREVDMKDAIIQMLDRDLDEAEEQYQTAHRSHLRNVDGLIDLFDSKMAQVCQKSLASAKDKEPCNTAKRGRTDTHACPSFETNSMLNSSSS